VALDPALPSPDGASELRRPPPPRTWRDRIEQAADATGTTPARIVVGGVVAIGAVLAGLWLTRPPTPPVEVSLPFASTTVSLAPAAPTSSTTTVLLVHVAGAVVLPGVHELPPGSRVVDAIEVAGGLAADADSSRLNLAAPLADGERVYVLHLGEESPPAVAGSAATPPGGPGAPASGPIDLNTADEAALDGLPGIGPATAAAIVEHRSEFGRFTSVDQLLDVRGIGPAKLDAIRDLVRV
jgi:competence protein ComEA